MLKQVLPVMLSVFAPLMLSACGGEGANTGHLSLAVTDAPVDSATAVVVQFTGVELHGPDGSRTIEFDTPKNIDLLALTGSASEDILDDVELPAGQYHWMRLMVNAERVVIDSYIDLEDGSRHSLFIPSGAETGLKLVSGFVIPAGGSADFTIDFDLRKSVHKPEDAIGDYLLRPALRIVDNTQAGNITGTVSHALIGSECAPVVYLFAGSDATPDDEDDVSPNPITSAIPAMNANTGDFDYEIGFILEGDYTASFSCDGDLDEPDTDDAMTFTGTRNVTVTVGETGIADFR
ncbi:MAG TPA: DUF4382 domain-containing protein [Gammaproteobacteria bacterium]